MAIGLANRSVPKGESLAAALELAHRFAALPPQAVRESKRVLNAAVRAAVDSLLQGALDAEFQSFDEPAFRANLQRMLDRSK